MPSGVTRDFKYDEAENVLRVWFQTGRVYDYLDVPGDVAEALEKAASKGVFFKPRIKPHYRFRRLGISESSPRARRAAGSSRRRRSR